MQTSNCLNCGQALQNQPAFCPLCGQKTDIRRISFHELWHDMVHYFTHADKGIFNLLKHLTTKPGIMAREYIEGKRKKYFKPLNFYLIVAGILVFVTSFFYKPDDRRSQAIQQAALKTEDPVKKKELLDMAERNMQVSKITGKYSNVINMVAMPLLTIAFWLVYYKGKYNYVEHLVANMYFIGFIVLFYSLIFFPLLNILPDTLNFVVLGLFLLFEILFRGYAYFQFINKKGIGAIIKAYGTSFLITIIWSGFTSFLISYYIRYGFF